MNGAEFQKLAEDCYSLIQVGHKIEATKRWRKATVALISLKDMTAPDAMEAVPTLERYLSSELDKWYIIYMASLKTSIFKETAFGLGNGEDEEPSSDLKKLPAGRLLTSRERRRNDETRFD